ncbi:MAG: hypothetical protein ACD_15C00005G0002 [uncultured bacterium]|nr:MAG: hypothetical protein ACD_15C00005G0002 [uncultured bacterium]HCU70725.1 hypothetical protein [Candidatus Moranbacteria bacterium]
MEKIFSRVENFPFICTDCGFTGEVPLQNGKPYREINITCRCKKKIKRSLGILEESEKRDDKSRRIIFLSGKSLDFICSQCGGKECFPIEGNIRNASITCGHCQTTEEVVLDYREKTRRDVMLRGYIAKKKEYIVIVKDISENGVGIILSGPFSPFLNLEDGVVITIVFRGRRNQIREASFGAIVKRVNGLIIGLEFTDMQAFATNRKILRLSLRAGK